ncbi:MAG: KamA family radical SAM protein [Desulfovibrionales bacterium]
MLHKDLTPNPSVFESSAMPVEDADDEPPGSCGLKAGSIVLPFSSRIQTHTPRLLRNKIQSTSDRTRAFRRRFFPDVSSRLWNDWHWQMGQRISSAGQLRSMLSLSEEEAGALGHDGQHLPLAVTPYYMSLIDPENALQPLRRTVIPTSNEWVPSPGEADDPLGEESQSPVHGLVHRYPDRVLLLVHDFCSTYCRYCTRSRVVGHGAIHADRSRLEEALRYIRNTPGIRDVLLSGGDPLLLSNDRLEWLLSELRLIRHVEIIRIGTKVPAVIPQRITLQLVRMLRRYHPLFMSLHFTHPEECTPEAHKACTLLADGGIPLGSQTVLLKGVNDDVQTMKGLMHGLLKMRVRPYYLYQCDPIIGSAHFRTTIDKGLEIIQGLRGHTSGYAVPTYVVDAPGGGGKIPLMPEHRVGHDGGDTVLRNYEGGLYRYPDRQCPECPG